MISLKYEYDSQGKIIGYELKGHAGYDERGYDIICAAVSILAINTCNSIESLTDDKFTVDTDESGYLKLIVEEPCHDSILLLNSFCLGIEGIIAQYGEEFVKIV